MKDNKSIYQKQIRPALQKIQSLKNHNPDFDFAMDLETLNMDQSISLQNHLHNIFKSKHEIYLFIITHFENETVEYESISYDLPNPNCDISLYQYLYIVVVEMNKRGLIDESFFEVLADYTKESQRTIKNFVLRMIS